jgi:predicted RNA-binding protein (virulence factor B family)
MVKIGRFNQLEILKKRDDTVWLNGGDDGELVLQDKAVEQYQPGDTLKVFVYTDGKAQLIPTLLTPKAQIGEVAYLKVVSTSKVGAFLDWGLPKDLLVPFSEQKQKMQLGRSYLVRLFLDEDNRITGSAILDDFIQDEAIYLKAGDAVDLIIADKTDLGFKAIVNHTFWGLLYDNEIFQPLKKGQTCRGYIKRIRDDKRIDLVLNRDNYANKVDLVTEQIRQQLQQTGELALNDKSAPEEIYRQFAVSKKIFKQALGRLYKQRQIELTEKGIRRVD